MKLEDIPDMDYTHNDKDENGVSNPRGEVCLRGPCNFNWYYRDEEKTRETIDSDGWLHTGDVGRLLPNGALKIIDRKKNLFKMAQGEYVAPEKIENINGRAKGVAEIFVEGRGTESFLVAVVVPNPELLPSIAEEIGIKNVAYEELCQNKEVIKYFLENIRALGKTEKLTNLELI